ncbi:MAG: NAD-dependent epimerase/dehydratase family protein [Clostridiales bacterium]|jgi:dTDP-glucose 4,6-dehydratase|nr:NAD-dependent epimerase/dehydratase family protein [Clostridiales bacterium]
MNNVNYLENDISNMKAYLKSFPQIMNRTFLITGSTGLIGSFLTKVLLEYERENRNNIKVYALCRNKEKAERMYADYVDMKQLNFIYGDVRDEIKIDTNIDYIIHGANTTQSGDFIKHPVETILSLVSGTNNILQFASKQKLYGFLYLSSLEIYGRHRDDKPYIHENDYGYIDITSPRSSYSEGKRMAENLCFSYAYEYNLPIKIARLTQTFGPGVAYDDKRVFAEFARCVIEERDIILHTEGRTVRNYLYIRDCAKALFLILFRGEDGEAYNVANPDTEISIYDMAKLIATKMAMGRIGVKIEINHDSKELGYNPEMRAVLSIDKLLSLGFVPEVGLEQMLQNTIESMRCNLEGK